MRLRDHHAEPTPQTGKRRLMSGYNFDCAKILWHSVNEAPADCDPPLGVCLLKPGPDGDPYALGYKEGKVWFTLDGNDGPDRFAPQEFALLE